MKYRVKAYTRREREDYGYVGYKSVHYQDLQVKRWWGWQTIDTEEVPSHVHISLSAFGDSGYPAWSSKWNNRWTWGRDGICWPKETAA